MKLFDKHIEHGVEVTRIDGIFPIFLVENLMNDMVFGDLVISYGWGYGYIGIPSWHPYYKMEYDNIPVSCHGGLTYGNLDEDENLWVIGFDTCHSGDNGIKWSKDAVRIECEDIVDQCMNVKEAQRMLKLHKLKNS